MKHKLKEMLLVICVSYTLISLCAAVINTIMGTQNNNFNTVMMFVFTSISVGVLYLYKLFDRFSPLVTITIQYLVALALAMGVVRLVSLFDEVSPKGYWEFFVSFTVFYLIGAVWFYITTFLETRKMNQLIKEIQTEEEMEQK